MRARIAANAPIALLVGLSALLVLAVAWGDALRFYPRLVAERAEILAVTIAEPIADFAKTGRPMADFTGFAARAEAALAAAEEIKSITVRRATGDTPFVAGAPEDGLQEISAPISNRPELERRLGAVGRIGEVVLGVDLNGAEAAVRARLLPLGYAAGGLALGVLILLALLHRGDRRRMAVRAELISGLAFAAFALTTMAAVFDLYREGAQLKTDAFAGSLAGRLGAAVEIGLDPVETFSGLDEILAGYVAETEDVAHIAIRRDGATIHAAPSATPPQFGLASSAAVAGAADLVAVATMPLDIVVRDLWRAGRNFLVLFIACAVAGYLLIAMGRTMGLPAATETEAAEDGLIRIRAIYFLGVGMDSLVLSFLPSVATEAAVRAGWGEAAGSWPFAVYFIALTLALIPAGARAARGGGGGLLLLGAALSAAGFGLLCMDQGFWTLLGARAISGAGQGVMLVGAQAAAMAAAPPGKATRAASVQVFAYNAGFLCGASIGGMLYNYTDARTVFLVAALTGAAVLALAAGVGRGASEPAAPKPKARAPITAFAGDVGFLATLGLVGIVSKFLLAGVVMFGAPLLLASRAWPADSVGQMMMVFAIATLIAIPISARMSDRSGDPGRTLVSGALISAAGVALLGMPAALGTETGAALIGVAPPISGGVADALTTMGALALLGLGQGTTAAPLIAQIARTRLADRHGRDAALGGYRLLERLGHISGPAALGAVGLAANAALLVGLGGAAAICAVIYAFLRPKSAKTNAGAKT